jgi:hypothetical protein
LTDDDARLTRAYRTVVGREPSAAERRVLEPVLAGLADAKPDARLAVWTQVFHALLASPDFRYVE